ncbi:hypothetical protein QJS66_08370 [Kocuria rhizophila]|nr:hypothetical protein QJS66_08370 [Kocuria rhizophila]
MLNRGAGEAVSMARSNLRNIPRGWTAGRAVPAGLLRARYRPGNPRTTTPRRPGRRVSGGLSSRSRCAP